jgi:hypothetical protein
MSSNMLVTTSVIHPSMRTLTSVSLVRMQLWARASVQPACELGGIWEDGTILFEGLPCIGGGPF